VLLLSIQNQNIQPMGNGNNYYLANPGYDSSWKMVSFDHNSHGVQTCNGVCKRRLAHWSIVRPTCSSLESNQLVGPLLSNATLHAQYIEYVRSFVDQVIGNASFIKQIREHGKAIQQDVTVDDWSQGGVYFEDNIKTDPTLWNKKDAKFPLLPLYAARVTDVRNQLEALDNGTFPRGPHLDTPVEPNEVCVDWRSTTATPSRT
jgi:hypothetical protein